MPLFDLDDFLAEAIETAALNNLTLLYDSGDTPATERQIVFGDRAAAATWDQGANDGYQVTINIDEHHAGIKTATASELGVSRGTIEENDPKTQSERSESILIMLSRPSMPIGRNITR
ncbi:hypothetical protein C6A86_018200 [Mycobacterium sp. ITM-2016-00316]|uniref:hypothetical protein n=1 Tax=Mycobacterium sp. ITM-2016-00316 TaxID=2099695 RepID=UPI000CF89137|nr:hypothetical protein [Mycobacterium sp. ITM-2016-00316]WNG80178.1 hypothetical protein C6A86_018200 [Mycobacterium sp. ITM-2016-00316]